MAKIMYCVKKSPPRGKDKVYVHSTLPKPYLWDNIIVAALRNPFNTHKKFIKNAVSYPFLKSLTH